MLTPVIERYCTQCEQNELHQRRGAPGAGNVLLAVATFGAWAAYWAARSYVCENCGARSSRPPRKLPPSPTLTRAERARGLFVCRTCRKVNSTRETECLRCAAPRPPAPTV